MNRLLVSLALAATPLAALADVLVDQASTTNPDGYYSDAYSTAGSQTYAQTEADTFALTSASNLTSISFDGSSEYYQYADLTNFSSFQIRLLDASNDVLYDTTVATSALTPTATGATNVAGGAEYLFTLSGLNLSLAAGSYVLSIGAVESDPNSDAFVWSVGVDGDGTHLDNTSFTPTGYTAYANDLAFTVDGTRVQSTPEPASAVGLSLGAWALLRRRRRSLVPAS